MKKTDVICLPLVIAFISVHTLIKLKLAVYVLIYNLKYLTYIMIHISNVRRKPDRDGFTATRS